MARDRVLRDAGLLRAGPRHDSRTLVDACVAGDLVRVRRGWYVGANLWSAADADARLRITSLVVAADQPGATLSHWSAAALHGLPLVGRRDDRVHLVLPPAAGGRSAGRVVRHTTQRAGEWVVVDRARVTPVARTVADVAALGGVVAGLCAADDALRRGLTTTDELVAAAEGMGRRRGVRAARWVAGHASALSESPGESLSRARMLELGIAEPVLQHVVEDQDGFVGRVDFWWPRARVVGEFDGREKYGLTPGADAGAAAARLWAEKTREDRIRATGARVVRWTWAEAWAGAPLLRRLRAAGVR